MAQCLSPINRVNSQKRLNDPQNSSEIESELLKALKMLFSNEAGANDAISNNNSVAAITSSLASPQLPSRKTALEILIFLNSRPSGLNLVLKGFDEVQTAWGALGRFEVWFKFFEEALEGRGKMGSVVGASESVMSLGRNSNRNSSLVSARVGALDSHLTEYAVCFTSRPI